MTDEQLEEMLQLGYKKLNDVLDRLEESCLAFNLPISVMIPFTFDGKTTEIGVVRSSGGWGIRVLRADGWKHFSEVKFAMKLEIAKKMPELREACRREAEKFLPDLYNITKELEKLL